ncbi:hypothetical protein BO70DRAFT_378957 [Aspergillus heteromorphus CBS 117.55]|uniref:SMP-30/Gluconolactonase/LRE-like region domain-containing protein n=1 Tax=Aspergillus heteromorphus CBS 117.55 TaxID=1448321 RepID=A0A317WEI2_9EURO|nr:uncharacterized protein BO70DRAFT_378957 [Aspergillus heteromorphus CBS 117.55]PWY84793.1 hypothetical protein BO70DRAFT_378957 [Aspergillus heteromorphus CBS 117.55]
MHPRHILPWLSWPLLAVCATPSSSPSPAAKVTPIYQFQGSGTWAENIAIRSTGNLLVTRVDAPELWSVDPIAKTGSLVHRFNNATALMGITEIYPDVFAVAVGNATTAGDPVTGSWAVWTVDTTDTLQGIDIQEVVAIPEAVWPNGLGRIDDAPGVVLVADCVKGVVWKVDLAKRTYAVALEDSTMAQMDVLGINGVHGYNGSVYYTSTALKALFRVPVDGEVRATGPVETVAQGFGVDDFAIAPDGTFYVMTHAGNTILRMGKDGVVDTFAGAADSLEVAGPTAGQVTGDGKTLFVVTCGGCGRDAPDVTVPAGVLAVELDPSI